MVVVYPEAIWYSHVQAGDVDEIVAEHLIDDRVVERLRFDAPPGNHKTVDHYPAAVHSFKDAAEKLQKERETLRQATLRTLSADAEA
jgi:(2Fe-2S) ferredoxin